VKLKHSTLEKAIRAALFEDITYHMPDVAYGIHDRPGPKEDTDPDFKPTVPPQVPLKPTEMMSTQLADEKPPVEDENYAPTSVSDLRQAASALASMVPPDKVEQFYRQMHKMLDDAKTADADGKTVRSKQVQSEIEGEDEEEGMILRKESRKRNRKVDMRRVAESIRKLAKVIKEGRWGDEPLGAGDERSRLRSPYDPEYAKSRYYDEPEYQDFSDVEEETAQEEVVEDADESILKQLALEYGFGKDANSMRQALHRLFKLMNYMITKIGAKNIDIMMGTVVPEFVNTAVEAGIFEPEDATDLMTNPVHVKKLDSFRFYFNELYRPVYQKLRAGAEKSARDKIASLGIPKAIQDTVFNQATGGAERKMSTIVKRLEKAGVSAADKQKALETVRQNFTAIQKELSNIPATLLDSVHDEVDRMGDKKKQEMILKAFGLTKEWQEEEAARAKR
jgi:hypothetical protein